MRALIVFIALLSSACTLAAPPGTELVPGTPRLAVVARYGALSPSPPHESVYDRNVTVTNPAKVARLAADANGLPPFPKGTIYCPNDDGSHYRVLFVYPNGFVRQLFVQIRGCQGVGFEDDTNWIAWSLTDQRFLDDLAALFGPS